MQRELLDERKDKVKDDHIHHEAKRDAERKKHDEEKKRIKHEKERDGHDVRFRLPCCSRQHVQ